MKFRRRDKSVASDFSMKDDKKSVSGASGSYTRIRNSNDNSENSFQMKDINVKNLSYFHDGSCVFIDACPSAPCYHDEDDRPNLLRKTEN